MPAFFYNILNKTEKSQPILIQLTESKFLIYVEH